MHEGDEPRLPDPGQLLPDVVLDGLDVVPGLQFAALDGDGVAFVERGDP
jgi:hypothetical protein